MAETTAALTTMIFFGSFFLNFITAASLQYLLAQLALLQQMVYFPGLNLLFPANVLHHFGIFKGIVTFDLYQVKHMNEALFNFTPTEPLNRQLWIIGVKSSNFILANKTFFYILAIQVFLMIIYVTITLILFRKEITWTGEPAMRKIHTKLKKHLIWKHPIELIKIGQFSYLLAALVNVFNSTLLTSGDWFSYTMAWIIISIYTAFPFIIFFVLLKYLKKEDGIEGKEYTEKFDALTSGLRSDSKLSLAFIVVFLGRRSILILLFIVNNREV